MAKEKKAEKPVKKSVSWEDTIKASVKDNPKPKKKKEKRN